MRNTLLAFSLLLIAVIVVVAGLAALVQFTWNAWVAPAFGVGDMPFWAALVITVLFGPNISTGGLS